MIAGLFNIAGAGNVHSETLRASTKPRWRAPSAAPNAAPDRPRRVEAFILPGAELWHIEAATPGDSLLPSKMLRPSGQQLALARPRIRPPQSSARSHSRSSLAHVALNEPPAGRGLGCPPDNLPGGRVGRRTVRLPEGRNGAPQGSLSRATVRSSPKTSGCYDDLSHDSPRF